MTFEMPDESQIPPFVSQFLKHFVAMAEPWDFWERLEKVVKNQSDLAAQNTLGTKVVPVPGSFWCSGNLRLHVCQ